MKTHKGIFAGIGAFFLLAFFAACSVPMTGPGAISRSAIDGRGEADKASPDSAHGDIPAELSGPLHITKECSQDTGLAGAFCTITSSNLKAIKVGSRVVYLTANAPDGSLNSDIILYPPGQYPPGKGSNLAFGHVVLPATGDGIVTMSGGTGKFEDFQARAVISQLTADGINWAWDGWYSFFGESTRDKD